MSVVRGILTAALVCAAFVPEAGAELKWLAESYDFGVFKEVDGPRTGEVRFVNLGPESTVINKVRPSCGCTGASYTDKVLEPGDTATVTFTYNPMGRPGRFEKTVKVYTGADDDMKVIKIRGTVVGAPATLERDYPVEAGPLRLSARKAEAKDVRYGTARHLFLNVYNASGDPVTPVITNDNPALTVGVNPSVIPAGDLATIGFYINTRDDDRMGPVEYPVTLSVDGREVATLTATATIVPNTKNMTPEEIAAGPRAALSPETIEIGRTSKRLEKFRFDILSEGEQPLNVTRVFSRNSAVRIRRSPAKIKSGKKGRAEGTLDLSELPEGPFRIYVEVLSDDTLRPVRTVTLVGEKNGKL